MLPPPRPNRGELILVIVALGAMLMAAGARIKQLEARPLVSEASRSQKSSNIHRGPSETITTRRTLPDGTKESRTEKRLASEDIASKSSSEKSRSETQIRSSRTRYIGLSLDPLDYYRPRFSAGLTFFDTLDFGGYVDTSRRLNNGALGLEGRYRF